MDVPRITRNGECVRSLQYRGVLIRVVHEGAALQVFSTEVEPGSGFDRSELGNSSVCHYVLDGNPVFESPGRSADLMPGDSIFFSCDTPYQVRNRAPSRSVILSVLIGRSDAEAGTGAPPAEG